MVLLGVRLSLTPRKLLSWRVGALAALISAAVAVLAGS